MPCLDARTCPWLAANYLLEAAKYPSTFGTTVVLGSDRGLGLEMAKRLHEAGCPVVGTCRKQPSSDLAGLGLKAAVSGIDFLDHEVADKLCKGLRDAGITKIDTVSGGLRRMCRDGHGP